MPRVLLLGKDGQVGWELQRSLRGLGEVIPLGREDLDLADLDGLRRFVRRQAPDLIVNAAAYTDVDGAESETEHAARINADAPGLLAREAARQGTLLIHFSTDYVFDGRKRSPYLESDPPNPVNRYGLTKLQGEQAIEQAGGSFWIFRTSWVYSTRRPCIVTRVLQWAREKRELAIVDDRWGSPTWCGTLAMATAHAAAFATEQGSEWTAAHAGVYHLACSGAPSRFELAQAVLQLDPHDDEHVFTQLLPASTDEFPTPARRPPFTVLDSRHFEAVFGLRLPEWREALKEAFQTREDSLADPKSS
jgi:dTDP-4-dehydrorhamnose reductase